MSPQKLALTVSKTSSDVAYVRKLNVYGLFCVTERMSFLMYPRSTKYKKFQNKANNTVLPRTLFWLRLIHMAYGEQMVQVRSTRIHHWHLNICPSVTRRYFSDFERMGLDLVPIDLKLFGHPKMGVSGKRCEQIPKYGRLSGACFKLCHQFVLSRYTSIRNTVGQNTCITPVIHTGYIQRRQMKFLESECLFPYQIIFLVVGI